LVLLSFIEFIGHFHPLLVHLPIGFLLIALLLHWMSLKNKYASLQPAIPVILLFGTVAAFTSCITGYLLSISDDYDQSIVSWHMWMGIAVTLVSLMLYAKEKNPLFGVNKQLLAIGLFVLVMVTGHLGGSLTHGSDYLTKPLRQMLNGDSAASAVIKPIANLPEAVVYTDIIRPILESNCYGCHNANKQKGGLRMDELSLLMKGGKNGKIIEPGNPTESEMIKRLLLPIDDDDHMPPKEKPQPTESQLALLQWWITNNADPIKSVREFAQTDKIKPILTALQTTVVAEQKARTDIPVVTVAPADEKIIEQLKGRNIVVLPVAQNTHYLMASFVTDSIVDKKDLELLSQLKPQLIWLKLNITNITDEDLSTISQLTNLTKLDLSNTFISDKGLAFLTANIRLQTLNLVGTKVTVAGITALKNLHQLQTLYLYKTGVVSKDWSLLKAAFPKTNIDTGGYKVPLLSADTMEVKAVVK